MFCHKCGTQFSDQAKFCPRCGEPVWVKPTSPSSDEQDVKAVSDPKVVLPSAVEAPTAEPTVEPAVDPFTAPVAEPLYEQTQVIQQPVEQYSAEQYLVEQNVPQRSTVHPAIAVLAIALSLVLGLVGGYFANKMFPLQQKIGVVNISVVGEGLGKDSSPIPFRLTGQTAKDEEINSLVVISEESKEVEIVPGDYKVQMAGSPVTKDGGIFEVPSEVYDIQFSSSDDLPTITLEGEETSSGLKIELKSIPLENVSDEDIAAVKEWMQEAQLSDVDVYVDAVTAARDAKQEELKAEADAKAKAEEEAKVKAEEEANAAAQQAKSEIQLSLDDRDNYHDLSLFLSNFSEVGFYRNGGTYTSANYDIAEVGNFAFMHAYVNRHSSVEYADENTGLSNGRHLYYPDSPHGWEDARLAKEYLDKITSDYLGKTFDYAGDEYYLNGYYYKMIRAESNGACGPTTVTSIKDRGSNEYLVRFKAYYQDSMTLESYDALNSDFYYKSEAEMAEYFGEGPNRNGTAVVKVQQVDGKNKFTLVSFQLDT